MYEVDTTLPRRDLKLNYLKFETRNTIWASHEIVSRDELLGIIGRDEQSVRMPPTSLLNKRHATRASHTPRVTQMSRYTC
jgi:hypothetical protein